MWLCPPLALLHWSSQGWVDHDRALSCSGRKRVVIGKLFGRQLSAAQSDPVSQRESLDPALIGAIIVAVAALLLVIVFAIYIFIRTLRRRSQNTAIGTQHQSVIPDDEYGKYQKSPRWSSHVEVIEITLPSSPMFRRPQTPPIKRGFHRMTHSLSELDINQQQMATSDRSEVDNAKYQASNPPPCSNHVEMIEITLPPSLSTVKRTQTPPNKRVFHRMTHSLSELDTSPQQIATSDRPYEDKLSLHRSYSYTAFRHPDVEFLKGLRRREVTSESIRQPQPFLQLCVTGQHTPHNTYTHTKHLVGIRPLHSPTVSVSENFIANWQTRSGDSPVQQQQQQQQQQTLCDEHSLRAPAAAKLTASSMTNHMKASFMFPLRGHEGHFETTRFDTSVTPSATSKAPSIISKNSVLSLWLKIDEKINSMKAGL